MEIGYATKTAISTNPKSLIDNSYSASEVLNCSDS